MRRRAIEFDDNAEDWALAHLKDPDEQTRRIAQLIVEHMPMKILDVDGVEFHLDDIVVYERDERGHGELKIVEFGRGALSDRGTGKPWAFAVHHPSGHPAGYLDLDSITHVSRDESG